MTESLVFTVDLEVVPGKLDALRNHVENAVAAVRENEPDVLTYAYYLSEDETKARIIEHYANSEAMLNHLRDADTSEFFTMARPKGATLHGSPSPELRELLTGFGARFHSLIDGNFR